MMRGRLAATAVLYLANFSTAATAEPYEPMVQISGTLRAWGADGMKDVMDSWIEGFVAHHPQVTFDTRLVNTALAMPGLATGAADIGLMGREAYRNEVIAYVRYHGHPPLVVEIATGAFTQEPGVKRTFPPVFWVHKDNPIERLTLAQVDGIFGAQRSGGWDPSGTRWEASRGRASGRDLVTWGQLGLTGRWRDQPIHPVGFVTGPRSGVAHFIAEHAFDGGDKWTERLTEKWFRTQADGSYEDVNTVVAESVGADRLAIGYGASQFATPEVKPVALARDAAGPFVHASVETVRNRTYPLARPVYIFGNRRPGQPLEPRVREFLRYVLSDEGQQAIEKDGRYYPLPRVMKETQLKLLDPVPRSLRKGKP